MNTDVVGPTISAFSRAMLKDLGSEAAVPLLRVTSVQRTVPEQARALVQKHVIGGKAFNYRNPQVTALLSETKAAYHDPVGKHRGNSRWATEHIAEGIYGLKGGPQSASKHIVTSPFIEVFDVSLKNLSSHQRDAFLTACRARYPFPISRLGIPEKMHPNPDAGREGLSPRERKQARIGSDRRSSRTRTASTSRYSFRS
jgi:hypothetical protein